ncbi:hypothetical protein SAMN05216279_105250 [Pseudomonas oryzihabitans]|uniref:Uncharacterized protein n=2 Tax=Pseudomonas oryzihabitans TaxID=47885 RepID=A0A1G5NDH2_9PSED|nr:hypothetical protein SAMN05216279_105250 [Pseudomonas psychrotolerans]
MGYRGLDGGWGTSGSGCVLEILALALNRQERLCLQSRSARADQRKRHRWRHGNDRCFDPTSEFACGGVLIMGRQRTIRDQNFWRSPRLLNCTTEDKVALLHLLTAPDSNITGVYPLVPRIAGAELGWTADQWLQVIHRLQDEDLVRYDHSRFVVWVRLWWEHHSASQVTGPKLKDRAIGEIRRIPDEWRDEFLDDFKERLTGDQQRVIEDSLQPDRHRALAEVSIPQQCGIDTISTNVRPNNKPQQKTLTETSSVSSHKLDMSGIPSEHQTDVHRGIVKALTSGKLRFAPQVIVNAMAQNYRSASSKPQNAMALTLYLAEHLQNPFHPIA